LPYFDINPLFKFEYLILFFKRKLTFSPEEFAIDEETVDESVTL